MLHQRSEERVLLIMRSTGDGIPSDKDIADPVLESTKLTASGFAGL
jgi:hypothetical protein